MRAVLAWRLQAGAIVGAGLEAAGWGYSCHIMFWLGLGLGLSVEAQGWDWGWGWVVKAVTQGGMSTGRECTRVGLHTRRHFAALL